jgi:hypothetical protein
MLSSPSASRLGFALRVILRTQTVQLPQDISQYHELSLCVRVSLGLILVSLLRRFRGGVTNLLHALLQLRLVLVQFLHVLMLPNRQSKAE